MTFVDEGTLGNAVARDKSQSASEYSDMEVDDDRESDLSQEPDKTVTQLANTLNLNQNAVPASVRDCGLCGQQHGDGECAMVERSENLVEYRKMLIKHTDDEPWDERVSFLNYMGSMSLTNCRMRQFKPLMKSLEREVIFT